MTRSRAVQAAAGLGVRRVRLSGGEPLVRAGLPNLVATIARTLGIEAVSLTTNGLLLARQAEALARAGLRRVNVSLDTLVEGRFRQISRIGRGLGHMLEDIRAAQRHSLTPVKINHPPGGRDQASGLSPGGTRRALGPGHGPNWRLKEDNNA